MSAAQGDIAGLILAAGESRRMGFPKALLKFREETFLDHLIGLFSRHCSPVVAVLGAEAERIRGALLRAAQALIVLNADYRLGQITSMQCGLRAMPAGVEGVLFTLVDHPNVQPATVAELLAPPRPLLRIPRYRGRRGHPLFFSGKLIPELLALSSGASAREVINRHAAGIQYLDLEDPGILDDVDDPEAYGRLTGEAHR